MHRAIQPHIIFQNPAPVVYSHSPTEQPNEITKHSSWPLLFSQHPSPLQNLGWETGLPGVPRAVSGRTQMLQPQPHVLISKTFLLGACVAQSVKHLPSAQVMISESRDQAPHQVLCSVRSRLLPLPLCALLLSLSLK